MTSLDERTHAPRLNARSRSIENEDPVISPRSHLGSEYLPEPEISASPEPYAKKKVWEGAYKSFLTKGGKGKSSTNSLDLDHSSPSSTKSTDTTNSRGVQQPQQSKKKHGSFSILPGSKRLVTRTPTTPQRAATTGIVMEGGGQHSPTVPKMTTLGQRVRSFGKSQDDEHAVRGGKYFKSVFRKNGPKHDELDAPLRKGREKTSASPEYASQNDIQEYYDYDIGLGGTPQAVDDIYIANTNHRSNRGEHRRVISEDDHDVAFDYLVESGSAANLAYQGNSSSKLSIASLNDGDESSSSWHIGTMPYMSQTSLTRSGSNGVGMSLLSQQIQYNSNPHMMTYDQPFSAAAAAAGSNPQVPSSSSPNTLVSTLSEPSFTIGSSSPSSLVHQHIMDTETKKMFTMYHNDARYNQDATEPFLGNDVPTSQRNYPPMAYMSAGLQSHSRVSSLHCIPSMMQYDPPPLAPVDEDGIVVEHNMRLLKPLHGTEHWEAGRRYLIAAAALASCPMSVVDKLSGSEFLSAKEAAASNSAFGTIHLGQALITYVRQTRHLSAGKWSSCNLVLRQNYLLEYDVDAPKNAKPRGFAHLQMATAYASPEIPNSLELHFFASPCAQADPRMLLIQLQNREDRDSWVFCLNRAARLQPGDLWEFDEKIEYGSGRYAKVRAGRRKDKSYYDDMKESSEELIEDMDGEEKNLNRALKVIDKGEFWKRVVKGRERADTLVRELSVQSTLTAKCGRLPSILQLRAVFETSQTLVLELELLEGHDLFEYISRKGVMDESEACMITKDILRSLEAMNRVGVAHRDIKPANLLMCRGEDDRVAVKVGDFGMSTFVGVDGLVRGRCGTPGYAAPEILTVSSGMGYGNQVDVFSAGVTLYVMLCGYEPFYGESEEALIDANKEAIVEFPQNDWSEISRPARDLIRKMLKADPGERITAKEALEHPWIQERGHLDTFELDTKQLSLDDAPDHGACQIS